MARICTVSGCEKSVECRGLCAMHYYRMRRHGDVHAVRQYHASSFGELGALRERFLRDARITSLHECWPWGGATLGNGYGQIHGATSAHVAAVLLSGREIPKGMQVDHVCETKLCVNPIHLRLATASENQAYKSAGRRPASGYRGVYRASRFPSKPWQAQLRINGRSVTVGFYETPEEAARARDAAAIKHHGEFAKLNFPDGHSIPIDHAVESAARALLEEFATRAAPIASPDVQAALAQALDGLAQVGR